MTIMEMAESDRQLKIQEQEKLYSDMKVDQLMELARGRNMDTKGEKSILVQRLVAADTGIKRTSEKILLEEAILSWSSTDMRSYLNDMKRPQWGSKMTMTERIMSYISIEDAAEIIKEYTKFEKGGKAGADAANSGSQLGKDDERKRKRHPSRNLKAPSDVVVDEDTDDMDWNEDEVEEKEDTQTTQSARPRPNMKDNDEVVVTKVVTQATSTPQAPPTIVQGKTSDKDTDFSASARGGNDLSSKPDEAGWVLQEGDSESVATERVHNSTRTRIGLSLVVPPSTNPDKQLCAIVQKWFLKLKEIDPKLTLLPWKKDDESRGPIKTGKKIPYLMSQMRVYFTRVQARSEGGKVFTDVFLQHTVPISDLRGDAEWFLRENEMGMYDKDLQVEATERKGWFLYSTSALDKALLAEKIEEEIGCAVSLRWKYVNTDKYEAMDRDERKKWMAMHIEVATPDGKKAGRGLARLYDSKSRAFPLGIRMRLVSEFREVKGNTLMMGKHTRLRIRQSSFLSMLTGHPQDEIMLLDFIPKGGERTLRSMLMGIQSLNPQTPGNLFHAVGKDWKGRIILNSLGVKEAEAAMIADGLIPYLHHHYGDMIYSFFDPEAVVAKEEWFWDAVNNTIVNPLSKELDGLENVDDDYDFTVAGQDVAAAGVKVVDSNGDKGPPTAAELAATRLNMVVTGGDDDSVSTMGNPLTPARIRAYQQSSVFPVSFGVNSAASVNTSGTMDTRMTAMEETMQTMAVDMEKKFDASIDKFFARMQAQKVVEEDKQPPGGASAGGDND